MIVLWVLLWVVLGLLALVFLLLLIPVRGEFRYTTEPELVLRYLFLRFPVLPAPEKAGEEKKPKPKKEKTKQQKEAGASAGPGFLETVRAAFKAEGFSGFLELLGKFTGLTGTLVWELIQTLRVKTLDLCVVIGGADAAAAAVLYGQSCAVVYGAVEVFCRLAGYRSPRVTVDLDFNAPAPTVQCEVVLAAMPLRAAIRAVRYFFGVLPLFMRFQRSGRRGLAQRRASQTGKEAQIR